MRTHETQRPVRTLRQAMAVVLRPVSRRGLGTARGIRDKCPVSALVDEPAGSPEARVAGKHDGLISMLDANLVEDPGNMIADRFLRQAKRSGDLRVAEAFGDAFQNGALTRGELAKRQTSVPCGTAVIRLREKTLHLGDELFPRRLVREQHVVFGVELDEAAMRNEACEQSGFIDRYISVAFGVHDQNRTFDLPRGFAHIDVTTYLEQTDGGIGAGRGAHLATP